MPTSYFLASRFWIAVRTKASKPKPKEKKECVGTLLCMMSCKGGYHLGETGPDGCQSCTCLKTGKSLIENDSYIPDIKNAGNRYTFVIYRAL
jgi:hypothetical protein